VAVAAAGMSPRLAVALVMAAAAGPPGLARQQQRGPAPTCQNQERRRGAHLSDGKRIAYTVLSNAGPAGRRRRSGSGTGGRDDGAPRRERDSGTNLRWSPDSSVAAFTGRVDDESG